MYYLEKQGSHWISFFFAEKQGAQTQIFQVALRQENLMSPGGSREGCVKTTPRWLRDALQPPQIQRGGLDKNTCVHIHDGGLRCVSWNIGGLIGSPTSA